MLFWFGGQVNITIKLTDMETFLSILGVAICVVAYAVKTVWKSDEEEEGGKWQ